MINHLAMFAQATDLPSVPPDTLKWTLIIIASLVVLVCVIYAAWNSGRASAPVRVNDDPPVKTERVPKRFNHDLAEQRFHDHERRIAELENWRAGLITKLDDDKKEILEAGEARCVKIHTRINYLLLAVGRIAGKLGVSVQGGDEGQL